MSLTQRELKTRPSTTTEDLTLDNNTETQVKDKFYKEKNLLKGQIADLRANNKEIESKYEKQQAYKRIL